MWWCCPLRTSTENSGSKLPGPRQPQTFSPEPQTGESDPLSQGTPQPGKPGSESKFLYQTPHQSSSHPRLETQVWLNGIHNQEPGIEAARRAWCCLGKGVRDECVAGSGRGLERWAFFFPLSHIFYGCYKPLPLCWAFAVAFSSFLSFLFFNFLNLLLFFPHLFLCFSYCSFPLAVNL